ncbi:MAG: adenosylcobalamin-dependent ribonucleoside-diphosphate reductase [Phycisphaeraceae bacterium]|nr:adenosylcobalamin-dependent ribonucleoside-diphosphate reductase [Phycisphaeraceae bacterium]
MKIARKFTSAGSDPFASVKWVKRSSKITNPDGSVVFQMDDAEVPETWSQLATDIMVSKYFRKAGVPLTDQQGRPLRDEHGKAVLGPEKSARQVIHRLAGCWRHWGEKHGYFDTPNDAQAFYDELAFMMTHQMSAPNSPQWFNTGLNWAYGISGPAQGHWVPDPKTGKVSLAGDAYTHPQPHACFIQSVTDDLVNDGGIMDLWVREARLFKYGSGTGTNFSHLRAENERLSGGGKSSGLMSWLKIGDRAAGAIKSGGTTRRAAKMVCLDMDHPDIESFINWKVREEIKVQAMVEGLKSIASKRGGPADPYTIGETAQRLGLKLDYDFNGEAYATVSGQNSNNSVRIPDEFFDALDTDADWQTFRRTDGDVAKTYKARGLWDQIGYAAWRCADPGVQFDSTINAWHTCPSAGRINASNPCSEYMFLDNTACNLASLNILKFYDSRTREFDVDAYEHAIDLWTIVLEISVLMASYPSREVAELSWKYRTLGLGYANLGAMLMQAGISYDSEEARAVCGCLTSILTGRSYRMSALMAAQLGPFPGFEPERDNMLRVIRNHRLAAHGVSRDETGDGGYENLRIPPVPIDHAVINAGRVNLANAEDLLDHSTRAWDEALSLGDRFGYRNAQVTVIAPTGTIGLLMDCDTTGIEPDFALVKFKKLAGGGYFKIANASVAPALEALGYSDEQTKAILTHLLGTLNVDVLMPGEHTTFRHWLLERGFTDDDIERVNKALPGVFEITFAFNPWTLGDDCLKRCGIDPDRARADMSFNMLRELGLTKDRIAAINDVICGTQTIEGAPHLKDEDLPVFDCANKCGKYGVRFIAPTGHIRMMAAAQPFISGAISKTINLPNEASVEDIKACYRLSWELGLKANALYRDGCKLSQPLSAKVDEEAQDDRKESSSPFVEAKPASSGTSAPAAAAMLATSTSAATVEPTTAAMAREVVERVNEAISEREIPERVVERVVERPMRRRLRDTRASITHKFNIGGHEGYLTVGLYDDGMPGELFITMAKEGSTIGGLMDSLGTAVSVALQYGVPVESLVNKFTHQRFEPAGMTTNRDIPFAKSLVDYIFRWMGMEFIPGYREANIPHRSESATESGGGGGGGGGVRGGAAVRAAIETVNNVPGRTAAAGAFDDDDNLVGAVDLDGAGDSRGAEGNVTEDDDSWDMQESRAERAVLNPGEQPGAKRLVVEVGSERATTTVHVRSASPAGGRSTSVAAVAERTRTVTTVSALSQAASHAQADAPACDSCGSITVRSGTCYKCLNCGQSMGCS